MVIVPLIASAVSIPVPQRTKSQVTVHIQLPLFDIPPPSEIFNRRQSAVSHNLLVLGLPLLPCLITSKPSFIRRMKAASPASPALKLIRGFSGRTNSEAGGMANELKLSFTYYVM